MKTWDTRTRGHPSETLTRQDSLTPDTRHLLSALVSVWLCVGAGRRLVTYWQHPCVLSPPRAGAGDHHNSETETGAGMGHLIIHIQGRRRHTENLVLDPPCHCGHWRWWWQGWWWLPPSVTDSMRPLEEAAVMQAGPGHQAGPVTQAGIITFIAPQSRLTYNQTLYKYFDAKNNTGKREKLLTFCFPFNDNTNSRYAYRLLERKQR